MSRQNEDNSSIWASRHSPEALTGFGTREFQRPRAGTLPSRLPSRLDTSRIALERNQDPPLSLLGSLALISPDGNDILLEDSVPPSSRSAVGQQPNNEKRRSPPLASIPEPSDQEDSLLNHSTAATSATTTAPLSFPISVNAPISRGSLGEESSCLFPSTPHRLSSSSFSQGPSVITPNFQSVRSRAGSMNSVAMRPYTFNPFGNSIWGPGSTTSPNGSSGDSAAPLPGASNLSVALNEMKSDPTNMYSNDLRKVSDPIRLRSYTVDGYNVDSTHSIPSLAQASNRVQPLLNPLPPPHSQPQLSTASRFGNPHQMGAEPVARSEGLDSSVVRLGDISQVPTPALWIINVPPHATTQWLQSLFSNFGKVESATIISSQRCAHVVFASTAQAIEAKATAHGKELYVDYGPSSVVFAQHDQRSGKVSPQFITHPISPELSTVVHSSEVKQPFQKSDPQIRPSSPISSAYVLKFLNASTEESNDGVAHLTRAQSVRFDLPIPPLSELVEESRVETINSERIFNATVLRDLRRKIDTMMPREIEELALNMQQELPQLASDYIGNTVVQLVFERSSQEIRDMMLRRLVSVFAATGTHKNGTWAVQKMIDLARGARQYALIEQAIRPHLVALLLDQFGNYVVQACLKFGKPYSDFVYVGVARILAQVANNRFGARAVRALLESEYTTLANQRLVATAIVQQISSLATNANGSLLVSWLLDGFERLDPQVHLKTHTLVANQLLPQMLIPLCCSKVGSSIITKLASSAASSQRVFELLFEPLTNCVPSQLVNILEDPSGQGATTVYRLLSSVFPLNSLERQVTISKVRMYLLRPKAKIPNHKRLLEECGLEMLQPVVASVPDPASPPMIPQSTVKYAH